MDFVFLCLTIIGRERYQCADGPNDEMCDRDARL
jgi:hypothetical protein